jgi:preprotein translocase subunit YajC
MSLFIEQAVASETSHIAAKQPGILESLLPFALIMVVFYIIIIRPQSKKVKEHMEMLKAVAKGDDIVTTSGIYGKIVKVDEEQNTAQVEIADNVVIKIKMDSISELAAEKKPAKAVEQLDNKNKKKKK